MSCSGDERYKKILSHSNCTAGTGINSCGATLLGSPYSEYPLIRTDIRRFCSRSTAPSHILCNKAFPIALGSPFIKAVICRNHTACSSLRETKLKLLTLPHRFMLIIRTSGLSVNKYFSVKIFVVT